MLKGIILAGGKATRLFPATSVVSKQLLPVYDKPMIYYPLTTLIEAGCREIMVITNPENVRAYSDLLYPLRSLFDWCDVKQQDRPAGIAQALLIASDHAYIAEGDRVFLALGDNLFHGAGLRHQLQEAAAMPEGAGVFLAQVRDPERYGVADFNTADKLVYIEEKPKEPLSNWAVTGLYSYDHHCAEMARQLKPSKRGELEITDLNNAYLEQDRLAAHKLSRSTAWLDTGTPDALSEATQYVRAVQHRSASLVGCPELAALENGWVTREDVAKLLDDRTDDYACQVRSFL